MGILQDQDTGDTWCLGARNLVGRASAAVVRRTHPRISAEHASLFYLDGKWWLRDLASRNGTWVDGKRVASGQNTALVDGAVLSFGQDTERLRLIDAAGPRPSAVHRESSQRVTGSPGRLLLSSQGELVLLVRETEPGWLAETAEGAREVRNGEVVAVGGDSWRLELPLVSIPGDSATGTAIAERIEPPELHFRVSRDEEHVELDLTVDGTTHELGARAHHYVLLLLARARIVDETRSDLGDGDKGWVFGGDLPDRLAITTENLNHQFWRLRRQLAQLGLDGRVELIERRLATRELRLAASRIRISPA